MTLQLAIASLLLSVSAAATNAGGMTPPARKENKDVFCGPRCVKFIVEYLGRPEADLFSIVREMQWPRIEEGVSLEHIFSALRRRGVEATMVKVAHPQDLQVACPAVLHLPRDGRLGHFVVLISTDREWCTIWDATSGVLTQPMDTLQQQASELVVAIGQSEFRSDKSADELRVLAQAIIALNIVLAICACVLPKRKSV